MTSVVLLFIQYVLRIPLRMSEEKLRIGDDAIHGEDAYAFGDLSPMNPHAQPEFRVIQGQSPSTDSDDADAIQPIKDKEGA